jgi:translation initiation factor 2B subunit (eIF-2B alpha/beta/delta family)
MNTIEQRIDAVRNDREHGSRWLVQQTITILRDLAQEQTTSQEEQMSALLNAGRALSEARPAMAALSSAVGRILNVQGGPQAIAQAAQQLLQEYATATDRIAQHARPYLAGSLMTCSISGTVLDVLNAHRQQISQIIVLEGRPRYEGRAMARALSSRGFAVTLLTDAQADIFIPQCQAIVVGADSILANGDVLNKAGTALLAHAARGHNVPFYVLCETLKISPRGWPVDFQHAQTLLEEKEPEEVLERSLPGVIVRNFYFDHTPYALVSKVFTELGILTLPDIQAIAITAEKNARAPGEG